MLLKNQWVNKEMRSKIKHLRQRKMEIQDTKTKLIETENKQVVARGWGVGGISEVSQKVQTSSYQIHKSRGCNVQHGVCS